MASTGGQLRQRWNDTAGRLKSLLLRPLTRFPWVRSSKGKVMKLRTEDGAAVIEFALVLPILLILVFGIINFGFALYNKEVITNASREGARAGIIIGNPRPSATQIKNVVTSYLTNVGWNASKATIAVTPAAGATGGASGSDLTVRVDYPYSFLVLPGLIPGFSNSITLSAQTLMKLE